MKRLPLVLAALLCLPLLNLEAHACECREFGTPICAEYWRSDAVFIGKLERIKRLKNQWDNVYEYAALHFVVEQAYRGVSGKRVVVAVATDTLCEPKFKTGKRYIMYASLDKPTRQLFTGACRRVGLAENMRQEEVDYLRKVTYEGVQETISGRVVENRYTGLPGISVRLKGNGKQVTTRTDKSGKFSFSLPGPGYYEVQVSVPYSATFGHFYEGLASDRNTTHLLSTFEYYITLDKNQCHYLEVDKTGTDPRAIATVMGNVVTATGEAVDKGWISLINVSEFGGDYFQQLKPGGSFQFELVAAGEYYLVLNERSNVPEEDAPHPRTYYPSAEDSREGKTIVVTKGASIGNLTLRAKPLLKEHKVSGVLVWNGELIYPYIAVYKGGEYVRRISMIGTKNFDFKLYGDFDYSIEARDDFGKKELRSPRMNLPPGDSTGLKLELHRLKQ